MSDFLPLFSDKIPEKILSVKSVPGGEISETYCVETASGRYFLKTNKASFAREMFNAERDGLQALANAGAIAVPSLFSVDLTEDQPFLLMDFIESKSPDDDDFKRLGTQLAELHRHTQLAFGYLMDNFISRLPQRNHLHAGWAEFYWHERIFPQLQRAHNAGLIEPQMIPKEEEALSLFRETFGDAKPSLLHGDLWGGNYLIATDGTPYLIDPAVYYGYAMADIAMTRLFSGFSNAFYDAYHRVIPKPLHYTEQIELCQLYYLLVHLNLFGGGYYSSVVTLMQRLFYQ
jgi:fructosamine-3-kinase